jgi:DNA helicase HerA-like ATPase
MNQTNNKDEQRNAPPEESQTNQVEAVQTKRFARPYQDLRTPFTVDENGAFAEYIVQDPDEIQEIALGATILVRDRREGREFWFAGRIVGLKAISPFNPDRESLLYIEEEEADPTKILDDVTGPHTHQPMVIRVQLDQEMDVLDQAQRKYVSYPMQRPPSAVSRLFIPDIIPREDSDTAPSLREILNVRPEGIPLGNIGFGNVPYQQGEDFLTYRWDVNNLDNKHMFIIGESGSGKTVLLKNLAYELRRQNTQNRVIMTDVQGDIAQLLLFDVVEKLHPSGWQSQIRTQSWQEARDAMGNFQLIIPARREGHSDHVVALRRLATTRGVTVRDIGLRLQDLNAPSDVEYLFRVASEQAGMLLDEEAQYLSNRQENVTIANLRRVISARMSSTQQNQITSDGGTIFLRSTYFAALRALRSLEGYFDFHQASLQAQDNPLNAFDFDGTTILFLDELDQDERIMWEMQLVRWLYLNKKEAWRAFIFFDEAHQIIPAKPVGIGAIGTFERLRVNFERLSREGRKFGINLILSTQDPKDLHSIVPEQCPTKIVMKINPRNATYAFLDKDLATIANRFGHGQFWIQSPFNGTPNWVRVHSWAPPLPHEPMTHFWSKIIEAARRDSTSGRQ